MRYSRRRRSYRRPLRARRRSTRRTRPLRIGYRM